MDLPPPFADRMPPPFAAPAIVSQWNWQGVDSSRMTDAGMRSHLQAEHGYSVAYLAGLTRAELIALHDRDHNAKVLPPASPCPGGVCPVPSAPARLFGRWR